MSIMMSKPYSSSELAKISSALTRFVNFMDLGTDRDLVVHCFGTDVAGWENMPAAWHRPNYGDIVVNVGTAVQSWHRRGMSGSKDLLIDADGKPRLRHDDITSVANVINDQINEIDKTTKYESFTRYGERNTRKVIKSHPGLKYAFNGEAPSYRGLTGGLAKTMLGVILHETGHSVFSRYITEPWYAKLDGYHRQIMTMLEELRCERQQTIRVGTGVAALRLSSDLVVNPGAIADDIRKQMSDDGAVSVPNLALNSILTLGRTSYGVFLDHEVEDLSALVRDVVGDDRRDEMTRIWNTFSTLTETDPDAMRVCAREWAELFPAKKDGSTVGSSVAPKIIIATRGKGGDDEAGEEMEIDDDTLVIFLDDKDDAESTSDDSDSSSEGDAGTSGGASAREDTDDTDADGDGDSVKEEKIELPGLAKDFDEDMKKASDKATEDPKDTHHAWDKRKKTPSKEAYGKAVDPAQAKETHVKEQKPDSLDFQTAKKLSRDLENLNVSGRGKFVVSSQTPPGRMNSRQAVQRSAERARGQMSTAKPWKRVKHTVDVNPPLTVGILTDVSGSQSWAEMLSARLAWIVSQAVTSIGGRAASVAFGDEAVITLRPGEHPDKLKIVGADGGTEQFDWAAGAIDTLLNLTTGTGVRLLFVFSDGYMVKRGEMRRTADWIEEFAKKGVHVFWITPSDDADDNYYGYPCTPKHAHAIPVAKWDVADNPMLVINELSMVMKREIAKAKRH